MNKTIHKQVNIKYGIIEADVDEGVASLILEIWKAGIDTIYSCQNIKTNDGRADFVWLFMPQLDANVFLNCVFDGYPRDEDNGVYYRSLSTCSKKNRDKWEFDLIVDTLPNDNGIHFSISIKFPMYDYNEVLENMKNYNNKP